MSFPTRERGLKFGYRGIEKIEKSVVPHAGTWIEISYRCFKWILDGVVPHAGTWIEIQY